MIEDQIRQLFGDFVKSGNEYIVKCPKCFERVGKKDTKGHLYVNPVKDVWNCFRCEWKGRNLSSIGIELKVVEKSPGKMEDLLKLFDKIEAQPMEDKFTPIDFPRGYTTDFSKNLTGKMAYNYLKSRGLSDVQINENRIGYASSGPYSGFIIFPIFEDSQLVYYVTRSIFKKEYKNAPVPNKNILFNFKNQGTIVLCEGIFDALSFGKNGVALLGKAMKDAQLQRIKNNPPKRVYICLDNDAKTTAVSIAARLKPFIEEIYMVSISEGKDPNTSTKKQLIEDVKNAIKVNSKIDLVDFMM